jgi:hypothetical protein
MMNRMKYPKSIVKIMSEAPLYYAIAACMEYKSKIRTAAQILKQWRKDKDHVLRFNKSIKN